MHLHRVHIPVEVLDLIFDELVDDHQTLARAAQCCRLFSSPALDVLWRELRSPEPLEKLLPGCVKVDDGAYVGTNEVSSPDWTRFVTYARRIRSDPLGAISSVYYACSKVRHGVIPFERLHDLTLSVRRDESKILLLFPPRLRRLTIKFDQEYSSPQPCAADVHMCLVSRQVPSLERLDLIANVTRTSLMCISEFKHLRTLDLSRVHVRGEGPRLLLITRAYNDSMFRDLIRFISEMSDLVELRFPIAHLQDGDIPPKVPRIGFRAMKILSISAHPKVVVKIFETFQPKGLRDITLGDKLLAQRVAYSEFTSLFGKIRTICGPSLRSFDFREGIRGNGFEPGAFFAPLLELALLENFSISRPSILVYAEHVQEMARAWPNLRTLKLQSCLRDFDPDSSTPSFAFSSLLSLAIQCPKLVTLHMIIDSNNVPEVACWPELSHGLQRLFITLVHREFPHSSKLPLAHLLDRIFPTLASVCVESDGEEPDVYLDKNGDPQLERYHRDDVWDAICMFQEARGRRR